VKDFADKVETDVFGNVSATVNPKGTTTILLDAHCDQIGLIVKHIDSFGFIRVNPIGGWDLQILLGQRMLVHTATGPVPGVIARKPIHLAGSRGTQNGPENERTLDRYWFYLGIRNSVSCKDRRYRYARTLPA
jgi:putative aminopeptidase FrvX